MFDIVSERDHTHARTIVHSHHGAGLRLSDRVPGMSLGKEPGRLQRPRQRIRARHRYFQHSAPGEIYELTADAIAFEDSSRQLRRSRPAKCMTPC